MVSLIISSSARRAPVRQRSKAPGIGDEAFRATPFASVRHCEIGAPDPNELAGRRSPAFASTKTDSDVYTLFADVGSSVPLSRANGAISRTLLNKCTYAPGNRYSMFSYVSDPMGDAI